MTHMEHFLQTLNHIISKFGWKIYGLSSELIKENLFFKELLIQGLRF